MQITYIHALTLWFRETTMATLCNLAAGVSLHTGRVHCLQAFGSSDLFICLQWCHNASNVWTYSAIIISYDKRCTSLLSIAGMREVTPNLAWLNIKPQQHSPVAHQDQTRRAENNLRGRMQYCSINLHMRAQQPFIATTQLYQLC